MLVFRVACVLFFNSNLFLIPTFDLVLLLYVISLLFTLIFALLRGLETIELVESFRTVLVSSKLTSWAS